MFWPQANTGNSHAHFISDFEVLMKSLKDKGLNTIVFDMNYQSYHFSSDPRLKTYAYPENKGFNRREIRQLAEITRQNNMNIIVALQTLTHAAGNVFPFVYPEYMLTGKPWKKNSVYEQKTDYVQHKGKTYQCLRSHVSNNVTLPPNPEYWLPTPSDTRDPLNKDSETVIFQMIDELINAFTVDGVKPEGFHIGCDELGWWYHDPIGETGKSSAQIFAGVIKRVYNHIKLGNPEMEVIMWGDMLDPYWNGSALKKNTYKAVDLLPKDLIVADWRYACTDSFRYDSRMELFPSVGEFIKKGFRVWPASWDNVKASADLVWTGNIEQAKNGRVMGHLYTTWLGGIVPELNHALKNAGYQVSDSILPVADNTLKEKHRKLYRGIADSIMTTAGLIGAKHCRGTDFHCGTFPDCKDTTSKNRLGDEGFKNNFCQGNQIHTEVVSFPRDYVGYWQFNGNPNDKNRINDGVLMNGAAITIDSERGQVARISGGNSHILIQDNDVLDMGKGSLSISLWFKAGALRDGTYSVLVSKHVRLTNYTLLLHQNGSLLLETNGNKFFRYSKTGVNYRDNNWHHAVAVFDHHRPTIHFYVNGDISDGISSFIDGTNDKSGPMDLIVGNNDGHSGYQFNGLIDDLMIFDRALSSSEAKSIRAYQGAPSRSRD